MSDLITTCPKCGTSVTSGGRFCPECGYRIDTPEEQPVETEVTSASPAPSGEQASTGEQMSVLAVPSRDTNDTIEEQVPETPSSTWSSLDATSEDETSNQEINLSPAPAPAQWQPGTYDVGATQPVEIPASGQVPPAQPYESTPGQTQSIFSPPSPPAAQGRYTQPIAPQGYTPPPAYNYNPPINQDAPPVGTQPLQAGQAPPSYPQYQQGSSYPQQAATPKDPTPKDPTAALMLELLGYLGFLGIGHIYAGKTNRGVALLIGWLVYLTASVVLIACLVGCFMFLAWLIVPPLSGLWVKNEMEKERITGIRQ